MLDKLVDVLNEFSGNHIDLHTVDVSDYHGGVMFTHDRRSGF
jgi:hypothetical protein